MANMAAHGTPTTDTYAPVRIDGVDRRVLLIDPTYRR